MPRHDHRLPGDDFDPADVDDLYILNEAGEPEACRDLMKWAVAMAKARADRSIIVELTTVVPGVEVSTVFLGTDYGLGSVAHLLSLPRQLQVFETAIFREGHDGCEVVGRCATRAQAQRQHDLAVRAELNRGAAPGGAGGI